MRPLLPFLLLPLIVSSSSSSSNLIVDVSLSTLLSSFSDLPQLISRRLRGFGMDHVAEGGGMAMRGVNFSLDSLGGARLLQHGEHLHVHISSLSGSFHGLVDFRSMLYERSIPWRRRVVVSGQIGPIHITAVNGFPFVDGPLHCKMKETPLPPPVPSPTASTVTQLAGKMVALRSRFVAKTEALACEMMVQVLDNIVRKKLLDLHLSMSLPTQMVLDHSLLSPPIWITPSREVKGNATPPVYLRGLFNTHLRKSLEVEVALSSRREKLRASVLPPFTGMAIYKSSIHTDLSQLSRIPREVNRRKRQLSVNDPLIQEPFDIIYTIHESVFTEAAVSLCEGGLFDRDFSVSRDSFSLSLNISCADRPVASFEELQYSWKMHLSVPLLYSYSNGTTVQKRMVTKRLVLSIHSNKSMFTFLVQSAFPQPDELGRFVFSNQIFRYLSSVVHGYLVVPLPSVRGLVPLFPSVVALSDRIIFAANFTK